MNNWKKITLIVVPLIVIGTICALILGCGSGVHSTTQNPNAVPAITSLAPSFAVSTSSSQTVLINGNGFTAFSSVMFNGFAQTATYISSQQMSLTLSQAELSVPGNYAISVTNPPPGGGVSTGATFGVWNLQADQSTGIQFAFPQFSSGTQAVAYSATGAISAFNVEAQSPSQQDLVPILGVAIYPNTSGMNLQQWFEANVDINGMLVAANTFQSLQFSNGVTALIVNGAIPDQYLEIGSPTDEVYAISPDGKYIIAMSEGQQAQFSDYGYQPVSLYPQILSSMTF